MADKGAVQQRSIFIDSSDLEQIKKWNEVGILDGVTTNQTILLKDGIPPDKITTVIKDICQEVGDKPVSVELSDSSKSTEEMVNEAKKYQGIAENIVVKVPIIPETLKSLEVISQLAKLGMALNITCMMTFEQMILASLATRHCQKPSFVSLFWARSIENYQKLQEVSQSKDIKEQESVSEVNSHPKNIVRAIADFLEAGGYQNPRIIVGSIRNKAMVADAFEAGGHIVTITPIVLEAMLDAPRTRETVKEFDDAWKKIFGKG